MGTEALDRDWRQLPAQRQSELYTLSPRQEITAAPYANSLRPGSLITSSNAAANSISDVYIPYGPARIVADAHLSSEPGVYGHSDGAAQPTPGAATYAAGVEGVSGSQGNLMHDFGVVGLASQGTYADVTIDYDSGGAFSGPNGVIGVASSDTGSGWGVYGVTNGHNGTGVRGFASAAVTPGATPPATPTPNYGVVGVSASSGGTGVLGEKHDTSGVVDTPYTFYTPGVMGDTDTGNGVLGYASESNVIGVGGRASGASGLGVLGQATGANSYGVYGEACDATARAGYFVTSKGKGVYISAPAGNAGLSVASGTKNAVVATNSGSRLLYTEESTEVWFTDYGFGKLVNGTAVIPIDPLFAQTVNLTEPYHVFVQAYGDADLYVSNRTPTQFEVHLHGDGDANVEFSYRVVAKRLGYENARLAPAPWADNDPNLYPGLGQAQPGGSTGPSSVSPDQGHPTP